MTDIDLDDLRKKALAATPGPWSASHDGEHEVPRVWWDEGDDLIAKLAGPHPYEPLIHDAEYIAAVNPATVLALIGALQRVRALGDAWEARGLSDMAFSEQVPTDCELAIYEAGVDMVERARILRNTLDGAEEASGDE